MVGSICLLTTRVGLDFDLAVPAMGFIAVAYVSIEHHDTIASLSEEWFLQVR
jgi:hypothetical protein